jgi:hypothetical protein
MTYSLIIKRQNADPKDVLGIKTWGEVLDYLRNKLDQWTIGVHIYKYSSNDRLLGERNVTMGNLWEVANSLTDKILL